MNVPNNLYDELPSTSGDYSSPDFAELYKESVAQSIEDVLIEIDLSGPEKSLLELIRTVRSSIEGRPDDLQLIIYFVAGVKLTNNDWDQLINYIGSLPNPKQVVYRGILHPETMKILTNFNTLILDKDVKFLYLAEKVPVILKILLNVPEIFKNFMERWIDHYKNIDKAQFDLTELRELGFQFQIIGQ